MLIFDRFLAVHLSLNHNIAFYYKQKLLFYGLFQLSQITTNKKQKIYILILHLTINEKI